MKLIVQLTEHAALLACIKTFPVSKYFFIELYVALGKVFNEEIYVRTAVLLISTQNQISNRECNDDIGY